MKKHHTISEIVGAVYCEQKVMFDREHGDARPASIRLKAAQGEREHLRFESENDTRSSDRRCFIASQIYGMEAPETNFLRAWRDRILLTYALGRLLASTYYKVSPYLVIVLRHSKLATWLLRAALNLVVKLLGMSNE